MGLFQKIKRVSSLPALCNSAISSARIVENEVAGFGPAALPTSKKLILSSLIGIFAGLTATLFLTSLNFVTHYRYENPQIIWGLPFAGLLMGWLYHRHGKEVAPGTNLILDEIHEPKNTVPFKMAPLIFFSTLLTQLFGGSAGREGAAAQMSATLADQLGRFFKVSRRDRKFFLVAGVGAGFGAAIGAPLAGIFFGMEVIHIGRLKIIALIECVVASAFAYAVTQLLHAPHSIFQKFTGGSFQLKAFFYCFVASFALAFSARFFMACTHAVENFQNKFIPHPLFRPFVGGTLLVALYHFFSLERYAGLGTEVIQLSILRPQPWFDPLLKTLLTALTIGSGFKGGEFVPLVFIGATLGSTLAGFDPTLTTLLAGVGFAAVFGAASKTPVTCSIMAIEIFGIGIAPYAILTCFLTYFLSGEATLYSAQKKSNHRHSI